MSTLDELAKAKYISLETKKKDGTVVASPVWLVRDGDQLLVTTQGSSGKVKRIRNFPHVRIAPCSMRGKPKGAYVEATAEVQDAAGTAQTTALIAKKYGWLGRRLTKSGGDDRAGIVIRLA